MQSLAISHLELTSLLADLKGLDLTQKRQRQLWMGKVIETLGHNSLPSSLSSKRLKRLCSQTLWQKRAQLSAPLMAKMAKKEFREEVKNCTALFNRAVNHFNSFLKPKESEFTVSALKFPSSSSLTSVEKSCYKASCCISYYLGLALRKLVQLVQFIWQRFLIGIGKHHSLTAKERLELQQLLPRRELSRRELSRRELQIQPSPSSQTPQPMNCSSPEPPPFFPQAQDKLSAERELDISTRDLTSSLKKRELNSYFKSPLCQLVRLFLLKISPLIAQSRRSLESKLEHYIRNLAKPASTAPLPLPEGATKAEEIIPLSELKGVEKIAIALFHIDLDEKRDDFLQLLALRKLEEVLIKVQREHFLPQIIEKLEAAIEQAPLKAMSHALLKAFKKHTQRRLIEKKEGRQALSRQKSLDESAEKILNFFLSLAGQNLPLNFAERLLRQENEPVADSRPISLLKTYLQPTIAHFLQKIARLASERSVIDQFLAKHFLPTFSQKLTDKIVTLQVRAALKNYSQVFIELAQLQADDQVDATLARAKALREQEKLSQIESLILAQTHLLSSIRELADRGLLKIETLTERIQSVFAQVKNPLLKVIAKKGHLQPSELLPRLFSSFDKTLAGNAFIPSNEGVEIYEELARLFIFDLGHLGGALTQAGFSLFEKLPRRNSLGEMAAKEIEPYLNPHFFLKACQELASKATEEQVSRCAKALFQREFAGFAELSEIAVFEQHLQRQTQPPFQPLTSKRQWLNLIAKQIYDLLSLSTDSHCGASHLNFNRGENFIKEKLLHYYFGKDEKILEKALQQIDEQLFSDSAINCERAEKLLECAIHFLLL